MSEWINDTPAGWMRWCGDLIEAWDAYCVITAIDPEAMWPGHADYERFEAWVAAYDA